MSSLAVVVIRVVRQQHPQPVADGDPGRDDRKASENRASCGFASLLSVCQAISIAMTTVLPLPVAILIAMRGNRGFDWSFAFRSRSSIQASPYLCATSVR